MLNFCDFIQVYVFTRNHHLKASIIYFDKSYCSSRINYTICFSIESLKCLCLNFEQINKIKDFDKLEKNTICFW